MTKNEAMQSSYQLSQVDGQRTNQSIGLTGGHAAGHSYGLARLADGWWLVLIYCERKILSANWWLVAGAEMMREKSTAWASFSSVNWGEKYCIRIPVAFRLYLVKIIQILTN
jgi:hypothetical protein